MIRSNVGNVVTNAQQILSVGATTLAGFKARWDRREQDSALNNIMQQQRREQHEAKLSQMSAKEKEILASASAKEELGRQRKARADLAEAKLEDYNKAHKNKTAEEEFAEAEKSLIPAVDTPENQNISKKISSDVEIVKKWTRRKKPEPVDYVSEDFRNTVKDFYNMSKH